MIGQNDPCHQMAKFEQSPETSWQCHLLDISLAGCKLCAEDQGGREQALWEEGVPEGPGCVRPCFESMRGQSLGGPSAAQQQGCMLHDAEQVSHQLACLQAVKAKLKRACICMSQCVVKALASTCMCAQETDNKLYIHMASVSCFCTNVKEETAHLLHLQSGDEAVIKEACRPRGVGAQN